MKVPFKMPEIFPNILGGGLEIWASIVCILIEKYAVIFAQRRKWGHRGKGETFFKRFQGKWTVLEPILGKLFKWNPFSLKKLLAQRIYC